MSDSPVSPQASTSPQLRRVLGSVLGPFLALGLVVLVFAVADTYLIENGGGFLTIGNFRRISTQIATVAVAALGMTVIIIAGGIDLSAGTAVALCATVLAWSLHEDVALRVVTGTNVANVTTRPFDEPPEGFEYEGKSVADLETLADEQRKKLEELRDANAIRSEVEAARKELQETLAILELTTFSLEKLTAKRKEYDRKAGSGTAKERQAARLRAAADVVLKPREARAKEVRAASETWSPVTPWVAIPLGILMGVLAGWVNGALISYSKVVPFIVTLGTLRIFLGVAKQIANDTTVRPDKATQIPDWLQLFLSNQNHALWPGPSGIAAIDRYAQYLRFPLGVWFALVLAALLAFVLRKTVFGRHVFALGSNEATARLCGVNMRRTKIAVYALGGFFVGVAGLYQFSRLSVGNPTSGIGLELEIIAAVVIGGGSLAGGRGSVLGTMTGAAIMAVIVSGCTQLELKNPVQDMILGGIIIVAVAVDQLRNRGQG